MKIGDIVKSGKTYGIYVRDAVQSGTKNAGVVIRELNGIESWFPRHQVHTTREVSRVLVLRAAGKDVLETIEEIASFSVKVSREDQLLMAILDAAEDETVRYWESREAGISEIVEALFRLGYVSGDYENEEVFGAVQACNSERLIGYTLE